MKYLNWFLIFISVFGAIGSLMSGHFAAAALLLFSSVFAIPQSYDFICSKLPFLNNNAIRYTLIVLLISFGGSLLPKVEKVKDPNVIENTTSTAMAQVLAKKYVKEQMVSPSSVEFNYDFSIGNNVPDRFVVQSYVEAKNKFGVLLRNRFSLTMTFNGGEDADPKNWTFSDFILVEQ